MTTKTTISVTIKNECGKKIDQQFFSVPSAEVEEGEATIKYFGLERGVRRDSRGQWNCRIDSSN